MQITTSHKSYLHNKITKKGNCNFDCFQNSIHIFSELSLHFQTFFSQILKFTSRNSVFFQPWKKRSLWHLSHNSYFSSPNWKFISLSQNYKIKSHKYLFILVFCCGNGLPYKIVQTTCHFQINLDAVILMSLFRTDYFRYLHYMN